MSNALPIDQEAVTAGFAQLAAEAAPPPEAPGAPGAPGAAPSSAPVDWAVATGGLVVLLDQFVAPNWELNNDEKAALSGQLAATLAAFFPEVQLSGKYQALGALVLTMGAIAASRIEDGSLRPMRRPRGSTKAAALNLAAELDGLKRTANAD